MENLIKKIQERISVQLIHMTISNPRTKGGVKKIIIRPVQLKNDIYFQKSAYEEKKVFHENLTMENCQEQISTLLEEFKQVELLTETERLTGLISKKGKGNRFIRNK